MKKSILLSLLAVPLLSAAEFRPETVASKAVWYVHTDMESLRETNAGKMALAAITMKAGDILSQIETYTGFDVVNDVADFTLYGNGQEDNAVLLIHADFDEQEILKIANGNDDYETSVHGANTVHSWTDDDNGKRNHASIYSGKTIIISEQKENVHLALDVLNKREKAFALTNPIIVKAPVFLGLANIKELELPKDDDGAKMIKRADTIALSLLEAKNNIKLNAFIGTADKKTAKQMATFLNGLVALASLASPDVDWDDIVKHRIERDGTNVKAELEAPLHEVIKLAKQMHEEEEIVIEKTKDNE